jgi:hypothetical protein
MTEQKKASRLTTDGKQPIGMTPPEANPGTVQKVVTPGPGDVQKGRQPLSMTPVTPNPTSERRGRQPIAMTPAEAPAQTPASVPVNPAPSRSTQGTTPQAPQSSADAKD